VTTPRITLGIESMKDRKGIFSVRKLMFEMRPTTATGIDLINESAPGLRQEWATLDTLTQWKRLDGKADSPEDDGDNHNGYTNNVSDDP
jgi:hypothetical protein